MRQAIVTKFLGPTDSRGSRIKCTAYAGSKTYAWDYEFDEPTNHYVAAMTFAASLGWVKGKETLRGGSLPGDAGYAFIVPDRK
jgi:hypothetical protein